MGTIRVLILGLLVGVASCGGSSARGDHIAMEGFSDVPLLGLNADVSPESAHFDALVAARPSQAPHGDVVLRVAMPGDLRWDNAHRLHPDGTLEWDVPASGGQMWLEAHSDLPPPRSQISWLLVGGLMLGILVWAALLRRSEKSPEQADKTTIRRRSQ